MPSTRTQTLLLCGLLFFVARSADAGMIVNFWDDGTDTYFSYSGSLNLSGMSLAGTNTVTDQYMTPNQGYFFNILGTYDGYGPAANISGPSSYGTSGQANITSTGPVFGFNMYLVWVPHGYSSNSPINGTGTVFGHTIDSLGIFPGVHTWTLASGDTIELSANSTTPVPEPATLALLSIGLIGVGGYVLRRRF